ncbi:MAG: agmatine deiminase family protein, partial [Phenylobacterium sp.]
MAGRGAAHAIDLDPAGRGDPDHAEGAARRIGHAGQGPGRALRVVRIPSPGWIEVDGVGGAPASHMNFIIANRAILLPVYGEGL